MRLPKILAVVVALVIGAGGAVALAVPGSHTGSREASGMSLAANGRASRPGQASGGSHSSTAKASSTTVAATSGLFAPAGIPLSIGPVAPLGTISGPSGAITTLPTPEASSLPPVAPLHTVGGPDAIVMLRGPMTAAQTAAVRKLRGVAAFEAVDTGTVNVAGEPVVTFGVDPNSFRSFTPPASAASDRLWQYVAAGSLVSSYEMATDRKLKLGADTSIAPAGSKTQSVRGWMGAFASLGLPGVDMVVSHTYSPALGLTPDSGLVVSAPRLDGSVLQRELQRALPGSAVELLHPDQVPQAISGNTLSARMRQQLISGALSRVGKPYVWGATGPDTFDCSGLVQWSYRQAGVLMPRTAAEQFLTGAHLPLADAQPGDLLFWTYDPNDPGFVDHTAIYLGNGLMVVAPHTGLDVEVEPVPTNNFAGAVRVILQSS